MNIVEMKMMDEYYKTHSIIDGSELKKPISFEEKQDWIKNNVSMQSLTDYIFNEPRIINIIYEHFS